MMQAAGLTSELIITEPERAQEPALDIATIVLKAWARHPVFFGKHNLSIKKHP
jgi:hypothetical protein